MIAVALECRAWQPTQVAAQAYREIGQERRQATLLCALQRMLQPVPPLLSKQKVQQVLKLYALAITPVT